MEIIQVTLSNACLLQASRGVFCVGFVGKMYEFSNNTSPMLRVSSRLLERTPQGSHALSFTYLIDLRNIVQSAHIKEMH